MMRSVGSENLSIDSAFIEELWRENTELVTRRRYGRRICSRRVVGLNGGQRAAGAALWRAFE
jgi:hypothetical protein